MNDYILFMHDDVPADRDQSGDWPTYLAKLRQAGAFDGGSSIGDGICVAKDKAPRDIARHFTGYLRIRAADLDHARDLVVGNPVFEAGGTVEIRELPRD